MIDPGIDPGTYSLLGKYTMHWVHCGTEEEQFVPIVFPGLLGAKVRQVGDKFEAVHVQFATVDGHPDYQFETIEICEHIV